MEAVIGFAIILLLGLIWVFVTDEDFWQGYRNTKFLEDLEKEEDF